MMTKVCKEREKKIAFAIFCYYFPPYEIHLIYFLFALFPFIPILSLSEKVRYCLIKFHTKIQFIRDNV